MKYLKGTVFNISRYAVHDGPGIRTTVFLKGCPLNCLWCHNPEGINPKPEIIYLKSRCIGCNDCVNTCVKGAIKKNDTLKIDYTKCDLCGECVEVCPSSALEIAGKEMTAPEMMEIIERDVPFYEQSGGGVTFSGGEPAMQHEFLAEILKMCKNRGIKTAIDTSGYIDPDILSNLTENADLILYDIKMIDPQKHKKWTGAPNDLILNNLVTLSGKRTEITVRLPLIPDVNDNRTEIEAICKFLSEHTNIKEINLLPYHDIARDKFERLGMESKFYPKEKPSREKIKEISDIITGYNFTVTVGG
jgi:pyruvate formate lyase activating enzyme